MKLALHGLGFISILVCLSNCAVFQKENLRLVTATEEYLVPKESPMNLILAPIYMPVGIVAGILDVFLVHPILMIPRAAEDTLDVLWKPRDVGYYTRMGSIPFSGIASPPLFLITWMYHWLFETSRSSSHPIQVNRENWKVKLVESMDSNDHRTFHKALDIAYRMKDVDGVPEFLIQTHKHSVPDKAFQMSLMNILLSYSPENGLVRSYILGLFDEEKTLSYPIRSYLENCRLADCRESVWKKIQDFDVDPGEIPDLLKIYLTIATPDEKKKLIQRLRSP